MTHGRIYIISLDKVSPGSITNNLYWKAHMSVGARQCARSAMAALRSHGGDAVQISIRSLLRVLELDLEAGDCPGNGLHLYCLTGLHTTNRVIACSLICNRKLACGKSARLDYCDVISAAGELGMTIITLGRLYFILS
jgi:hypothetical protein